MHPFTWTWFYRTGVLLVLLALSSALLEPPRVSAALLGVYVALFGLVAPVVIWYVTSLRSIYQSWQNQGESS